jgi:deoxyribonucleoside regulator
MASYDKRILTKVAHMYYDEDMTQQEIADKLGVSRPSVSRQLQKARQKGVVEIKICYEGSFTKLEDALEKKFGLREAIIAPSEESERLKNYLAEAAASYLTRTIKDGDIIGVSWGTTLVHIPKYIKNVTKDVTFVPLVGGVGQTKLDIHSNAIAINLAKSFGGKGQLLHAPVIVDSVEVKKTLISDTSISQVLNLASKANIALVGIGSPSAPNSTIRQTGYYTERELNDLHKVKAVCDISWIFIDPEGNLCPLELNQRVIGISIDDLKVIPTVIGVAGGVEKHEAILAALKGHYIDVLVTDEKTGNYLLSSV